MINETPDVRETLIKLEQYCNQAWLDNIMETMHEAAKLIRELKLQNTLMREDIDKHVFGERDEKGLAP